MFLQKKNLGDHPPPKKKKNVFVYEPVILKFGSYM